MGTSGRISKRITPKQRHLITGLVSRNRWSDSRIAKRAGRKISKNTIGDARKKLGLNTVPFPKYSPNMIRTILRLRGENLNAAQIAHQLNDMYRVSPTHSADQKPLITRTTVGDILRFFEHQSHPKSFSLAEIRRLSSERTESTELPDFLRSVTARRLVSPKKTLAIALLKRQRWSDTRIAKRAGIEDGTVGKYRAKLGLNRVPFPTVSPTKIRLILQRKEEKVSIPKISEEAGVSTDTVKAITRFFKKNKHPKSKRLIDLHGLKK